MDTPKLHQDTHWVTFDTSQVKVIMEPSKSVLSKKLPTLRIQLPNGAEAFYNHPAHLSLLQNMLYPDAKHLHYNQEELDEMQKMEIGTFLVDNEDMETIEKVRGITWDQGNQECSDLLSVVKVQKEAKTSLKFYLRTFNFDMLKMRQNQRVYAEEVAQMIRVLHELDGKGHLDQIRHKTLNMDQLKETLKEYDIDQTMITLVPDPLHLHSLSQMMPTNSSILTAYSNRNTVVTDVSQLVFHIFQTVVCDISWYTVYSDLIGPTNELREQILHYMNCIVQGNDSTHLHEVKIADDVINDLKSCPIYSTCQRRLKSTPLKDLEKYAPDDTIELSFFLDLCYTHALNIYCPPDVEEEMNAAGPEDLYELPVWKARILFFMSWSNMFFAERCPDLKALIWKALCFKMPLISSLETENDFWDVMLDRTKNAEDKPYSMKLLEKILEYSGGFLKASSPLPIPQNPLKRKLPGVKIQSTKLRKQDQDGIEEEIERRKREDLLEVVQCHNRKLQEQLSEAEDRIEEFRESSILEIDRLRDQMSILEDENDELQDSKCQLEELLRQMKAAGVEVKRSEEMKKELERFKGELTCIETEDWVEQKRRMIAEFKHLPDTRNHFESADQELLTFQAEHSKYKRILQENIKIIEKNALATYRSLYRLPERPELSVWFQEEYQLAKQRNEDLDNDCVICGKKLGDSELKAYGIWKCGRCPAKFCGQHTGEYFVKNGRKCPTCRRKLNK